MVTSGAIYFGLYEKSAQELTSLAGAAAVRDQLEDLIDTAVIILKKHGVRATPNHNEAKVTVSSEYLERAFTVLQGWATREFGVHGKPKIRVRVHVAT